MPRILFVSGFHPATRARDLAYEFERYGPLIRCDVPAPRNPSAHSNPATSSSSPRIARRLRTHVRTFSFRFRAPSSSAPFDIASNPNESSTSSLDYRSYAFVEFRSTRDAEDAYYEMHGRMFEGSRLGIQWAKNPPSSVWRIDRRSSPPRRDRSRSPHRRSGRDRDRNRERDRDRDREKDGDHEKGRDREKDRDRDRDSDRDPQSITAPVKEDDISRSPIPTRKGEDSGMSPIRGD
ncbi:hypothetical protein B0F90DRAFT_1818677 [Multifurca ochricompacta]|uniref:RRM domain-containing protein n=1 Tax=Multifurca ochricompacta TaxID=376703 RepID=A0AAD4QMH2_9AGAM|nr:hypothetical protein B0F90DRAFT_1818677 [Multifurca ochricompacta]